MKKAWSISEVSTLLGLPLDDARTLVADALEAPRDVVSFQELQLVRTAHRLSQRQLKKDRITGALKNVREEQPADAPLAAVTLRNLGKELVVEAGAHRWNAESGQALLDLGAPGRGANWLRPVPTRDAQALFEHAVAQEEKDADDALDAYAEAVAADPYHADAHVNLGRLLHQRKRFREAEAHYVAALVARPTDVTASFNLAVVLDDLGRTDEAIARYRETLELDPALSDAYFHLARLYEKKGEKVAALRHLKDYRRLSAPR